MTETGGQPPVSFPTKDVAVLLFLLRRLTRRGINAACGQCPASGRARDGRFYRSRLASVTVYASPSPFSDERPSSRFRGIALPSKRRRLRYSTVGLTRYAVGSENGGDGDAFVREEREAMDVVLQALDGETMS